jgi:hypothetical protein
MVWQIHAIYDVVFFKRSRQLPEVIGRPKQSMQEHKAPLAAARNLNVQIFCHLAASFVRIAQDLLADNDRGNHVQGNISQ